MVGIGSFLLLGRPWGVTSGFALWGAKAYSALGGDLSDWIYWSGWRSGQVSASLFANGTSVMNFGIVAGAMAAAALARKWSPVWRLSQRDILTAVIGGLMMGYGARLAYGCNIGAYLGGLVSGSLHGWWWLIWGFAGSYLGVWMRARLSMDPPITLKPAI
ncbi:MAG: YeeE/YedE thiosulfate transporter family protein [Pseudomonadota bacterium]